MNAIAINDKYLTTVAGIDTSRENETAVHKSDALENPLLSTRGTNNSDVVNILMRSNAPNVSTEQADVAAKHIMRNSGIRMSSLSGISMDSLDFLASQLASDSFLESEESNLERVRKNTDSIEKTNRSKIKDYIAQEKVEAKNRANQKKRSLLSRIFRPIFKVVSFVMKLCDKLVSVVPGLKTLCKSKIGKIFKILASATNPMTLMMTIGKEVGKTIVKKTVKIATKAVSKSAYKAAAKSVAKHLSKNLLELPKSSAKLGKVEKYLKGVAKTISHVSDLADKGTDVADGILLSKQSKLIKEAGNIEFRLATKNAHASLIEKNNESLTSNMSDLISKLGMSAQIASQSMSESGQLKSRIAATFA
ncbi:hypothetical protein D5952_14070 [Salmonella enterica subsp. enterica]|nr:hypothetical protein [Salmonella enterica subsp. enterica serovar Bonn]EBZ5939307.1 hypothetical protein [Salmonella enterica subsp. enterica serovar Muenchen]MLZ41050.1 hypothetical protein [Salmonella enterica subsp. enterica serovar Bonn]